MKYSVESIELGRALTRDDFVFFWGHTARADKQMKACLSQWWPCSFEVDGMYYNCAEQYMMAEKARLLRNRKMPSIQGNGPELIDIIQEKVELVLHGSIGRSACRTCPPG